MSPPSPFSSAVCLPAAVLIALAAALPAAAVDEPLLDTPQHAVLISAAAGTAAEAERIWVVRILPETLVYKDDDAADAERTLAARIGLKAVVKLLDGEVFRVDPRTGRFNRFDELTGRFAPIHRDKEGHDHEKVSADGPPKDRADGRDGGEVHTEIAEGTGTDASAALRDAFRNAVRQAVGVYVDSETLTDKDAVVADRILTYSDAFVVRYEEISRSSEEGLVTIKISAAIEPGKLMTNLREAEITTLDLVGQDLVAAALTRKEAKDTAAELLQRKFQELPGVLAAETVALKPLDYDAAKERLTVTYALHADREKYRAFLESLRPLARQVAVARTTTMLKVDPIWTDGSQPVWQDGGPKKRVAAAQSTFNPNFRYGPSLSSFPDSWCLWLMTKWDAEHRNTQWEGFALDVDLSRTLGDVSGSMSVRLELVDDRDGVILTESHDPLQGLARPAYWFGWVRPRPRAFFARNPASWPAMGAFPTAPILLTTFREPQLAVHENRTVNVYVSPMCYCMSGKGLAVLSPGAWQVCGISIPPDAMARVRTIRAMPFLVPAPRSGTSTTSSSSPSSPADSSPAGPRP